MKRYAALFLVLIILMFTLPSRAQDDTPVPTDEVTVTEEAAATVEPTSELASATPLPTGTPLPTATALPTLTTVPDFTPTPVSDGSGDTAPETGGSGSVIVIVISILTLVLGGGTLVTMVANFRKDAAGVAATEALGKSVPQELALELVKLARGLKEGAEIAIEALDNVPAASKPAPIAQFTLDELTAELARRGYKVIAS